jgi:hypothetical protein
MLKLKIDGAWEPEDFIEILQSVESLYYKAAHYQGIYISRPSWIWDEFYLLDSTRDMYPSFEEALSRMNRRLLDQASGQMRTEGTLRPGALGGDHAAPRARARVPTVGVAPLGTARVLPYA